MEHRIEIVDCVIENNFQQVNCMDEDGSYASFQDVVMVKTIDDRFFYLSNFVMKENEASQYSVNRYDPETMRIKVWNKRSIDPTHWVELSESPTFEKILEVELYRELEEGRRMF